MLDIEQSNGAAKSRRGQENGQNSLVTGYLSLVGGGFAGGILGSLIGYFYTLKRSEFFGMVRYSYKSEWMFLAAGLGAAAGVILAGIIYRSRSNKKLPVILLVGWPLTALGYFGSIALADAIGSFDRGSIDAFSVLVLGGPVAAGLIIIFAVLANRQIAENS